MIVSVLGTGNIGGTLGRKWAATGHRVTFGTRNASAPGVRALLKEIGSEATADTVAGAIAAGDVVAFAIPGAAVDAVVREHAAALDGKIVIDATNRLGAPEMSGVPTFVELTPAAKVFRAFNTMGWENLAEPGFGGVSADLFYCGSDDRRARDTVERLIADVGLRPVRVGGLDKVGVVDGVLRLWFALAVEQKMGRHLAFKLLTPPPE